MKYSVLPESVAKNGFLSDSLVSIVGKNDSPINFTQVFPDGILRLHFDDVPFASYLDYKGKMWHGPRISDIEEILEFGQKNKGLNKHLAIHCMAGQSRSPATALLLLCEEFDYLEPTMLVNLLQKSCLKEDIFPNPGIVSMINVIHGHTRIEEALLETLPRYQTWKEYWLKKLDVNGRSLVGFELPNSTKTVY